MAWSPAEGRKAPSRNSFARDKGDGPTAQGTRRDPTSQGTEACAGGAQGTGGMLSLLPSAKQPVASTFPATPARLTVPFPGPWGHPQSGHCSRTMGPLLCHEPPVPCPAPQEHGEQLGSSLQSCVTPVGLFPSIVPKSLCWSRGCSLPLTSGVLTHSCSWHFNPVKAIPSSDNNTATSCVRNPRYGIPPNPLLLSKAFTAFDLAHAVLGVGIVHSAR